MKNELQQISDFLDLGKIASTEKADGNANRNSYITTNRGKYLVKIIEERNDVNEVASEIPYLERLEGNLKVVPYVKNKNGQSLFHKDDTIALVQPFVDNVAIKNDEMATLELIGEQAQLHQIDSHDLPQRKHWIDSGYIKRTLKEINDNNWMINSEILKSHIAITQDWSGCELGIVHGDLHLGNALFNKNKDLLAIIDWEEVGIGYYIFDFAMTISAFCFEDGEFNKDLFEKMINTYEKIHPFSSDEKRLLDIAIQRAFITEFVWKCLRKHKQGDNTIWNAEDCKCFKYFQ